MKSGLQRIEATLNQLHAQGVVAKQLPSAGQLVLKSQSSPREVKAKLKTYSFDVKSVARSATALSPAQLPDTSPTPVTVRPFPVQEQCPQAPNLPKFKLPSFSSHRHAANPGFAMGLLKEMETVAAGWQAELQQIVMDIQELYLEGPIVDGWLESENGEVRSPAPESLRHAKGTPHLAQIPNIGSNLTLTPTQDASRKTYRLCGLDADGQLWSRPCPSDQLPHVSLAIARYQKLRQLLARKQDLEFQLSQLAQDLMGAHSKLKISVNSSCS